VNLLRKNAFINASKKNSHDADELFSLQCYLDVADLKVKRKNYRIEIAVKHCPVKKYRISKLSTFFRLKKIVINIVPLFKNTLSRHYILKYQNSYCFHVSQPQTFEFRIVLYCAKTKKIFHG